MKYVSLFILSFVLLNYAVQALAVTPTVTTFQTKIIKPDGQPLESSTVNFRFTTLDTVGTCTLYVEDFSNVNMSNSQGIVSISLGSGSRQYPVAGVNFHEVFNNSTASYPCQAGGSYIPGTTDSRQIVMQFNDGSGWQTLPQMALNSVLYSIYATRAESLGDYVAADYLRPATLPTCTVSQALTFNGTSFTCVTASGGGSTLTSVTSISNASGDITLAPKTSTNSVLISSGTTSTGSSTGALVVTGGVGVSGAINAAGNILSSGSIAASGSVSAVTSIYSPQLYGTTTANGDIKIDGTSNASKGNVLLASTGGKVGIGTTTPSQKLSVVGTIESTTGGFKFPDGSTQTTAATGTGTVTTVSSANADIAVTTGTTTPVLTLNSGTGAEQIVKLTAASKYPAVDGSLITNLNLANGTGTLPVINGGTGQSTYTNGQLLIGNTTGNTLTKATLTAGSGINITNGAGSITIATAAAASTDLTNSVTGVLPIANGGTNSSAALTNGKVMVSSAGAIIEGVASNTAKSNNTFVMRDGSGNIAGALGTFDQLALDGAVSGTLNILPASITTTYTLTLPSTAGTNGYVLSTNGAGVTSWVAQSSGGLTGTGTPGMLPKLTGASAIADSVIAESSGNIGIGTTTPSGKLDIASGTITASSPLINGTQTWNSGGTTFTAFKANITDSASSATSLLLDLQVGGVSKFKVDKTGKLTGDGSGLTSIPAASLTTVNNRRTCIIIIGADNASTALADADIAPQGQQCYIPANSTIVEINVRADAGTPNVLLQRRRGASTVADLSSAALATAASGAAACAMSSISQSCIDGTTSSGTITLSNTSINAGDWIETKSATAGGTAKRISIAIVYTVN